MKKLLLVSSLLLIGLPILALVGCKAKKVAKTEKASNKKDKVEESNTQKDRLIIHRPGVINQKQLDSMKAIQKMRKKAVK